MLQIRTGAALGTAWILAKQLKMFEVSPFASWIGILLGWAVLIALVAALSIRFIKTIRKEMSEEMSEVMSEVMSESAS